ncbi:LPS export ABC transporter permease LptF [Sabulicella rubraurantiaca]|uniref:LPS export ABC transporter permease LptF n=1 Tax=Sabulicella rubraurantiaca TaxID=2811429 RepID=UPI001A975A16|nr:LPS export ABC transporter permease LptF [Sabulicella rubraurantiaca]
MSRLDTYMMRQLGAALLAVTIGLAALVWLTQSLRFIELVLDRGLSLLVFLELTGLLLPSFFGIILPITTFVVTLFTYVRLASDRELVVMRAAGLSNWQLARPALVIGTVATMLCYVLNLWLTPVSARAFREWQFEIRNQMAGLLLQEGVFSSVGEELTVYTRSRDADGTLRGILVHDSRERGAPVTILAESGRLTQTPEGPRVTLFNGQRQQLQRAAQPDGNAVPRLSVLSFQENSLDLARAGRGGESIRFRNAQERTLEELFHPEPEVSVRDRRRFLAEAHQRLAGPLTALSFAMMALSVALTAGFRRHGGTGPLAIGALVMVGLLALGLGIGSMAARQPKLIFLIWLHALLPGIISAWVVGGMPGLAKRLRSWAR